MSTPVGPYTPIVRAGPWLVCSGQLGVAVPPDGGPPALVEGGAAAETGRALLNASRLLADQGASPDDVVKTTVFVTDIATYAAVNDAYVDFFGDHRPARSLVAVAALPMGAAVEIELWAYRDG